MTKLIVVLIAAIFFTSCAGSKNATLRNDNVIIEVPVQVHYSKSNADFQRGWDEFNALDDPTYY